MLALLTLNENFQPDRGYENYESLIWSERYSKSGDFQLTTPDVVGGMARFPRKSFVTLRDSSVPMRVENYKITKPKNAGIRLVITGRSAEAPILELRSSVNALPGSYSGGKPPWIIEAEKESDAAYLAMRIVLGDEARFRDGVQLLPVTPPAVSPLDAIPEISLTLPADYAVGSTYDYEIKVGKLYTTVLELLAANRRGLKAVRPDVSDNRIGIEIYNGADLTNEVAFNAKLDQIEDATYLLSEAGIENVAYYYGAGGSEKILKTAGPEPSGLDRSVLAMDESSDESTSSSTVRRTRALIELYKHNATALFDGQIAAQVALDYNAKYFLGDIIKLNGDYGLSRNVRVAEFIRSYDANGYKAYPTFEAVDDI